MIMIGRYAVKLLILTCLGLVSCSVRKIEIFPEVEFRMTKWMGVGTPPQNLLFFFDTGCPFTYVPSSTCTSCQRRNRKAVKYDETKSLTYKKQLDKVWIEFVDGAAGWGSSMEDVVEFDSWTIPLKEMYLIQEENEITRQYFVSDGIIGLSVSREAENIFQVGEKQGILSSSLFAFYQGHSFLGQKSYVYYNFTPEYFSDMFYVYVDNSIDWILPISALYIDNRSISLKKVYLDTGAPYIHLQTEIYEEIYREFFSSHCWRVGKYTLCSCDYSLFPDFEVYIGVDPFTERFIIPSIMYLKPAEEVEMLAELGEERLGACLLLVVEEVQVDGEKGSYFGIPFFSGRRVVFDKDQYLIGIGMEDVRLENFVKSNQLDLIMYTFSCLLCTLWVLFILSLLFCNSIKVEKQSEKDTSETMKNIEKNDLIK